MKYLIIHDAAPGQFVHLYRHLVDEGGHDITVASRKGSTMRLPVRQVVYDLPADLKEPGSGFADRVFALGLSLYRELKPLKIDGWSPDVILSHASSGASYFLRELFPDARIVSLFEWFYKSPELAGMKESDPVIRQKCRDAFVSSLPIVREFESADVAYTPTAYQKAQFPHNWQKLMHTVHDGIDTERYKPASMLTLEIDGKRFTKKDEIITYAARGMEHTRGFLEFMKAVAKLQRWRPKAHVLIAAADRVCYDSRAKGRGLKTRVDEVVDYDPERTHFVGLLPEAKFVSFLQISSLHVYLTRPFVLSWSILNAMSTGVPVLGSDTAPVREVITDGENGRLVNMDDITMLAEGMEELLKDRTTANALGKAGRQTVLDRYDLKKCLKEQLRLFHG